MILIGGNWLIFKWVFIKPNTFALLPLNSIFMGWGYKLSNKNIFSPVNTWSPSVMSSLYDCRKELINSRLAFKCTPFRDVWDHRLCSGICAYSYVHNINMHQLRPYDEIFSGFLNYIPTWKKHALPFKILPWCHKRCVAITNLPGR